MSRVVRFRPGFRSRHNTSYWTGVEYLGLGAGAHSYTRAPAPGRRWTNERLPARYVAAVTATGTAVELTDGRIIPTSTIVATIGNGPHRLVETLGLDLHWARIKTDRFMRVPGHDGVWALGDAALIPLVDEPGEDPLLYATQTAQFAVREGRQLAGNILAKIAGKPLKPFAYTSKGSLASLASVWGGSGSEAYQAVQTRWDNTSNELNSALQNLAQTISEASSTMAQTEAGVTGMFA